MSIKTWCNLASKLWSHQNHRPLWLFHFDYYPLWLNYSIRITQPPSISGHQASRGGRYATDTASSSLERGTPPKTLLCSSGPQVGSRQQQSLGSWHRVPILGRRKGWSLESMSNQNQWSNLKFHHGSWLVMRVTSYLRPHFEPDLGNQAPQCDCNLSQGEVCQVSDVGWEVVETAKTPWQGLEHQPSGEMYGDFAGGSGIYLS